MAYRLTRAAEEHIDALLLHSARTYGLEAAGRHGRLIPVVMAAMGDEPNLPGSVEVPRLSGIRAYPTRPGRRRVEPARRAAAPRHLVIYRVADDGCVEVPGLAHDRMVLSRAALKIIRDADER